MPLVNLDKYSDIFVETGTLNGEGVIRAMNSGYNKIVSIELDDKFYETAKQNFQSFPNVEIVHGDSGLVLGEVIKNINSKITFFLDGHYSGQGTAYGIHEFPLLQELQHIKNHHIKNHTILIDDIRCWKYYNDQLNMNNIINIVKNINEDYEFFTMLGHIEDDILVCLIP